MYILSKLRFCFLLYTHDWIIKIWLLIFHFRPRLRSHNGHLHIESATSRNISLITKGQGYINVNNENLLQIIERVFIHNLSAMYFWYSSDINCYVRIVFEAKEAWDTVDSFRSTELPEFTETMKSVGPLIDGPRSLSNRVAVLETQILNTTAIATNAKGVRFN